MATRKLYQQHTATAVQTTTHNGIQVTPKNSLNKPTTSVQDLLNSTLIGKLVYWQYHGQQFAGTILEIAGGNVTVDMNGCKNFIAGFKTIKSKSIHVLPLTRVAFGSTTKVSDMNLITNHTKNS
jgi:hypothetical protein